MRHLGLSSSRFRPRLAPRSCVGVCTLFCKFLVAHSSGQPRSTPSPAFITLPLSWRLRRSGKVTSWSRLSPARTIPGPLPLPQSSPPHSRLSSARASPPSDHGAKVFFVGAGIGGVEHLTVRAQKILQQADAVVYDSLADEELLALTPAHCERLFVGKRGGQKQSSAKQEDIDLLLLQLSADPSKRCIVRLKAGDPFIFGRTRSEIEKLQAAGVVFELVPGLSSLTAAPLLAGVPLTDPELSRSFAVLSGHDATSATPAELESLNGIDTLVLLMAGVKLEEVTRRLVEGGRDSRTPVKIVKWAGREEQEEWKGTLGSIWEETRNENLSPCVIVIGEVAKLDLSPCAAGVEEGGERREEEAGQQQGRKNLYDDFDSFLLDMDGVLWGGGGVIPGVVETLQRLREEGKRVFFVTNNSSKSRKAVKLKLETLGIPAAEEEVVTSGWAAAQYLRSLQEDVGKVFVIGSQGLVEELEEGGFECIVWEEGLDEQAFLLAQDNLDPRVKVVVSGWDTNFSWGKMSIAALYLQQGALFVATNPDPANRVGRRLMPENGAQLAALTAVTGRDPHVVGKPSPALIQLLMDKFALSKERTLMVGDRLDTDIEFGRKGGVKTALVLTGVSSREDLREVEKLRSMERYPDFVLETLNDVVGG